VFTGIRFSFLSWPKRIARPRIGESGSLSTVRVLSCWKLWKINCLISYPIGKWILGKVPMCLVEFMYWYVMEYRVEKDDKLGHQRFANNAVAPASRFFWPSSFCQPKAFNINVPPGLLGLAKLWGSSPRPRLSGSLDVWSEFVCFCVQSFWETAACADVMSLSPAPITCSFSLIIVRGCQSPVHPKSFGEGVHYDRGLQW